MAIATYAHLVSATEDWLERGDINARVPDFIVLAEAKLNRALFVTQMEGRSVTSVDTASTDPEFISLPVDFQSMRSLRLSGVTGKPRLAFMSQTQMDDYRYSSDNLTGQPVYFCVMGTELQLVPTPNSNYALEMIYRKTIPPLATNSPNWLLILAPDLYLYGTLLEAESYLQSDTRIPIWASKYKDALEELNTLGFRQSFDSGPSSITLPGVTP